MHDCFSHRYDSCTRGCCWGSNFGPSDPKAGVLTAQPSCSPATCKTSALTIRPWLPLTLRLWTICLACTSAYNRCAHSGTLTQSLSSIGPCPRILGCFAHLGFVLCIHIFDRFAPSGFALRAHILSGFAPLGFVLYTRINACMCWESNLHAESPSNRKSIALTTLWVVQG